MTEKYPASDFPAPPIKGYPGDPVTPDTAYPGCRLHHVTGSLDAVVVGFDPENRPVLEVDGDIMSDWTPKAWRIAPDNHPSPIGRDQCGVRKSDGVIELAAMFDDGDALLVYWGPAGGWRGHQWEPISDLLDRYAYVADTVERCEAWIAEQEKLKPRYAFESIASSDAHKITDTVYRLVDTRTGQRVLGPEIVDMLNAADRKTEGGE
jgi:hypothetical protein